MGEFPASCGTCHHPSLASKWLHPRCDRKDHSRNVVWFAARVLAFIKVEPGKGKLNLTLAAFLVVKFYLAENHLSCCPKLQDVLMQGECRQLQLLTIHAIQAPEQTSKAWRLDAYMPLLDGQHNMVFLISSSKPSIATCYNIARFLLHFWYIFWSHSIEFPQ